MPSKKAVVKKAGSRKAVAKKVVKKAGSKKAVGARRLVKKKTTPLRRRIVTRSLSRKKRPVVKKPKKKPASKKGKKQTRAMQKGGDYSAHGAEHGAEHEQVVETDDGIDHGDAAHSQAESASIIPCSESVVSATA